MINKKTTTRLNDYLSDVTSDERKFIDQEKKHYEVVVALKKKGEELGLPQEELAKTSNIPRTTITRVESGNRNVTYKYSNVTGSSHGKYFLSSDYAKLQPTPELFISFSDSFPQGESDGVQTLLGVL